MSVNWQRLVSLSFNQSGGFVSVNWQRLVSLSFNWAKRDLILLPKVSFVPIYFQDCKWCLQTRVPFQELPSSLWRLVLEFSLLIFQND